MPQEHPDLLIVGGGAAAFAAATRASDLDARATMVNDGPARDGLPLGGTCVNVGCLPSKHLLEALDDLHTARAGRDRWLTSTGSLDWAGMKTARDEMVEELRGRNYDEVLHALGNVTLVQGRARFTGPRTVEVDSEEHTADRVLVATGARTRLDHVPGLREANPLTNRSIFDLEELPASVGIIGAGPQGVEYAQALARAGDDAPDVTLIGRVLPGEEPEAREAVRDALEADGVTLHPDRRVERVETTPGGVRLHDDAGGVVTVERVLAATGLEPNTTGLGLEAAGVETTDGGFVVVDDAQRTSAEGVYAAGDVTGRVPLETTAARQGYNAAHHALTGEERTVDYDLVPHAVFLDPNLASVGWTEERMMEERGTCWCQTLPMDKVPRAHAAGDTRGFVKLVADPDTREILGAHAVCRDAAEIIHVPALAMRAGWTLDDLVEAVHVFPTLSEAWKICAQTFDRDVESMSCCIT